MYIEDLIREFAERRCIVEFSSQKDRAVFLRYIRDKTDLPIYSETKNYIDYPYADGHSSGWWNYIGYGSTVCGFGEKSDRIKTAIPYEEIEWEKHDIYIPTDAEFSAALDALFG